jgi:hypothetical protein
MVALNDYLSHGGSVRYAIDVLLTTTMKVLLKEDWEHEEFRLYWEYEEFRYDVEAHPLPALGYGISHCLGQVHGAGSRRSPHLHGTLRSFGLPLICEQAITKIGPLLEDLLARFLANLVACVSIASKSNALITITKTTYTMPVLARFLSNLVSCARYWIRRPLSYYYLPSGHTFLTNLVSFERRLFVPDKDDIL